MLKLKLQYFGHLMRRVDSLEKTLMLGGIGARGEGDDRGWDGWMASLTRWMWVSVNSGSWWWTARPGVLQFMGSQRVGHDWATDLIWSDLRVGLESVDSIFLHWLLNTFLSASLVPNYSYIWKQDHKMWTLLLSIIIIHWNTSWKTLPILHNYPASNTAMYITFRKFYENSKQIHILYISFRKVHAKWSERKILSAETFPVAARQSLRFPINAKVAPLTRW